MTETSFLRRTVIAVLLGLVSGTASADLFTNLDFESYAGGTTFDELLPGWQADTNHMGSLADDVPISTAGAGIVTTNNPDVRPVEGRYSAILSAGQSWPTPGWYPTVTIWQTAMVPEGATHIQFLSSRPLTNEWTMTWGYTNFVTYSYTLGSVDLLSGSAVEVSNDLYRYTTSIGSLAGQTSTLSFSLRVNPDLGPGAYHHVLDDIEFISIPEPSVCSVFVLGLLVLAASSARRP